MEMENNVHGESHHTEEGPNEACSQKQAAPDGGWGWVVCFACFMVNVVNDGIGFSFGVVFVELLDYFKGTKAETSWIVSLSLSVCFLSGPVVAALTEQFGCRAVAFAGTILNAVSLIISIFTPDLYFLYFSLGILLGIGDGMIYFPSIVCVSEYFEKRRAFATGLCVCGSGIGTFIFSPLTAVLIETYAWRGAVLIQAGLILNCLACSLVFIPVRQNTDMNQSEGRTLLDSTPNRSKTNMSHPVCQFDDMVCGPVAKDTRNTETQERSICITDNTGTETDKMTECSVIANSENNSGSSRQHKNNIYYLIHVVGPGILSSTYKSFRESFSLRQFRNRAFAVYTLSTFIYCLGYYTPYVFLPVRSRDAGLDEIEAAWVLSTVGISSTVGRVVFGFISDKKWVNRLYLYSTALLISGIGTAMGPVLSSFASLLIYAVVFGLFTGATVSLVSVLTADIVGIKNLSYAFGMVNFVSGFAVLIGPPLAGWLYDITGSYDGSFLASGATIAFSGAMLYSIPCIDKSWNKR